ncbi:MAG TPA: hypothetical protein VMB05_05755 [Solirubrobacteraceae bacterium]|nr:hypothetical protein [Solirubrobacteraceae bacterium]
MTDADASKETNGTPPEDGGVLAKLPRTRPQRASARRAAARDATSPNGRATLAEVKPARGKSAEQALAATPKSAPSKRRAAPKARATSGARTQNTASATTKSSPNTKPTTRPSGGTRPAPVGDSAASTRAKSSGATSRPSDAVRKQRSRAGSQTAKRPTTTRRSPAVAEPAPRQGYECEGERPNSPVAPPGGPELVASAAELVSELAKAGLSASERLFKDVFSRLPGS